MRVLKKNTINKVNSSEVKTSMIISQGYILTYFHIFTKVFETNYMTRRNMYIYCCIA